MADSTFTVGDRVYVVDPGLAQLRQIMRDHGHEPTPNHHGTVDEVWTDSLLITFDGGGCAPYATSDCRPLTETDRG